MEHGAWKFGHGGTKNMESVIKKKDNKTEKCSIGSTKHKAYEMEQETWNIEHGKSSSEHDHSTGIRNIEEG